MIKQKKYMLWRMKEKKKNVNTWEKKAKNDKRKKEIILKKENERLNLEFRKKIKGIILKNKNRKKQKIEGNLIEET